MDLLFLRSLALTGGDWVIYGLLLCSIAAVAVIIERGLLLSRELRALEKLNSALIGDWDDRDLPAVEKTIRAHPGAAARVLLAGLKQAKHGPAGVEDHMVAATLAERRRVEQRLLVLGTLGSNAPFIGLFGTVLGVIKAFHDLGESGSGPEVVMQGLSEALIATAVGLIVAIPCVVGFNYFQKKAKDLLMGTELLGRLLLAHIRSAPAARRQ